MAKSFTLLLAFGLTLMLAIPLPSAAEMVKKIDNFIVLLDQSGSMANDYPGVGKRKIDLAVDTIGRLDRAIPDLGYTGAFALFAPYQLVSPPAPFKKGALNAAAAKVNTDFHTYGRPTPMGYGLKDVDPVIAGLKGKTALIIFTDADSNAGIGPLPQAQALYTKYAPNLCIHLVSYADTPNGKTVVDKIRAMSGCSVAADGKSLASDGGIAQYAKDVFYSEVTPAKAPAPAPKMPMDSDGDGVMDDKDKCPGTPKGEIVDADGCSLKLTLHINFDFDKGEIKPEFKDDLAKAAKFINDNKEVPYILIAGHTDATGDVPYNQDLSLKRAEAVKNALVNDFGVPAAKLYTKGYGELQPIANNATDEGRYANRRVEIICCTVLPPK